MNSIVKKIPILFLIFYFFIGAYYSLKTGITHDEAHEQKVWEYNFEAVKGLVNNDQKYEKLQNYKHKYYGIGFQIISQPIQYPIKILIKKFQKISDKGAQLLSKHFVIFLFFFISGLFVYLILKKISNNKNFSYLSTLLYLFYPYLLGHGFYNPKDTAFACVWLICTYSSYLLSETIYEKKKLKLFSILIFASLTAFLISIRVAGILILIQYLITFIIVSEIGKKNILFFLKKFFKEIILFFFFSLFLIYIFYPVFWKNPFQIIDAIILFRKYPDATVCTMLFGNCIPAQNLISKYIPLWLAIKLPLIVFIGLALIPITEKKIFKYEKNKIFFGTILITILIIPIFLIFIKTALYDEIRQILFLIPLIYIIGISSLYFFSRKISYFFIFFFLIFFIYENIKIYPYQYSWMNIPSRFVDINKNFDSDYWGVSGRNLANFLSQKKEIHKKDICIFGFPYHSFRPFLDSDKFNCFKPDSKLQQKNKRPFIGIQIGRNLRRSVPNKCYTVKEEQFSLLFHKEKIVTGRLIYCT